MTRGYRFRCRKNEGEVSASRLPYVLKSALVTEKSTQGTQENRYTFKVDTKASKQDIAQAVTYFFDVKVKSVNTLNVKSKQRRFRGVRGRTGGFKKAIVALEQGQTIDVEFST